MTDYPIHRSATKEQQIAVDAAEMRGILRGVAMAADYLEREGDVAAAEKVRTAKIVEADQKGGK